MSQYVAIVEDPGPDRAVGIWFPDLPGCFSAGDTVEEAMSNASVALAVYAEALEEQGKTLPPPRSLSTLRMDAAFCSELEGNMVALIAIPEVIPSAAE